MNTVPRTKRLPGATWMRRPAGPLSVAGAMQVHEPSGSRLNAFQKSSNIPPALPRVHATPRFVTDVLGGIGLWCG